MKNNSAIFFGFTIFFLWQNTVFSNSESRQTIGLRLGAGLYRNHAHSGAHLIEDHLDTYQKSTGEALMFGMRVESDYMPPDSRWTLGISTGADINVGNRKSRFDSFSLGEFNHLESIGLHHRFEASLRWGWLLQKEYHLFLKGGAVLGRWHHTSFYADRKSDTKHYLPGLIVGGGMDIAIGKNVMVGGSIEYEQYQSRKGTYAVNGQVPFAGWSFKPGMVTLNATLKYKLSEPSAAMPVSVPDPPCGMKPTRPSAPLKKYAYFLG